MTTLAYAVHRSRRASRSSSSTQAIRRRSSSADGEAAFLPLQGTLALGASPTRQLPLREHRVPDRLALVLYTDGLVERRGRSIDDGLERLRSSRAARETSRRCARPGRAVVPRDARTTSRSSAARIPGSRAADRRWPAEGGAGRRAPVLRRWLYAHGATEDETFDITVASQEACANAVEHAYGPGRRTFQIEADYAPAGPSGGPRRGALAPAARQ